ncbi:MAG: hypothetical protein SFV51_27800 [Bryobacteraceae bacterium]|nr:hypothetical protein [Bryobacteraceae bacterium]
MSDPAAFLSLALLAALLLLLGGWLLLGARRSPDQRERARRRHLGTRGRLNDATVTGVRGDEIAYQYQVAGVVYDASQNVVAFKDDIPADEKLLLGPAYIKYSVRNPANSILISEDWCGLRVARRKTIEAKGD